jgi:hypothetical protein
MRGIMTRLGEVGIQTRLQVSDIKEIGHLPSIPPIISLAG